MNVQESERKLLVDAELVSVKTLIVTELFPSCELSRDSVILILMNPIGSGKTTDRFCSDVGTCNN